MNPFKLFIRRKTIVTIPLDVERLMRTTFAIAQVAEAKLATRETAK